MGPNHNPVLTGLFLCAILNQSLELPLQAFNRSFGFHMYWFLLSKSVRCWVSCSWIHPCFHFMSLPLMWMCFCLCACLWLALYSKIFGKCSVRCSALNGLIYGLTNLFALRFVLEPGLKELCKLGNAVNTHKITAEHSMNRAVACLFCHCGLNAGFSARLHWSTGFMSVSWTSMEISCWSSLVHSAEI